MENEKSPLYFLKGKEQESKKKRILEKNFALND
jgi:hypothetical protein